MREEGWREIYKINLGGEEGGSSVCDHGLPPGCVPWGLWLLMITSCEDKSHHMTRIKRSHLYCNGFYTGSFLLSKDETSDWCCTKSTCSKCSFCKHDYFLLMSS